MLYNYNSTYNKIRTFYLLPLLFTLNSIAHASSDNNTFKPIITVELTMGTANVGSSKTIPNTDDLTVYDYQAQGNNAKALQFGMMVGIEKTLPKNLILQSGFNIRVSEGFSVKGTLVQGVDPGSSDTFTYQYKVHNDQLVFQNKLLAFSNKRWHPYLMAGIGISSNTSDSYTTSMSPYLTFTPEFSANTNYSLVTQLGLGLDVDINNTWRIGAAYNYSHTGSANLGNATLDENTIANSLGQSNFQIHQFVLQLTYKA